MIRSDADDIRIEGGMMDFHNDIPLLPVCVRLIKNPEKYHQEFGGRGQNPGLFILPIPCSVVIGRASCRLVKA